MSSRREIAIGVSLMVRACRVVFGVAALAACAASRGSAGSGGAPGGASSDAAPLAITHVAVVPMDSERVLADQTVLVRGDRIVAVGPASTVAPPPGARRIDGRGGYLIPGLVDAHLHLVEERRVPRPLDDAISHDFAARAVAAGVTTALTLCSSERGLAVRDSIARGEMLGPALFVSPPCLDDSTMTARQGDSIATAAHARGFDFLKVYTRLSAEGFHGITDAARRLGMPVLGHIPTRVGLAGVLGAGIADIAHAEEFLYNAPFHLVSYQQADSVPDLDPRHVPVVAHAVHSAGAAVTPTLIAYGTILDQAVDLDAVLARPEYRDVPLDVQRARGWLAPENGRARRLGTPVALSRLRAALAVQRQLVRALEDSGVTLLAGTDAGGDIPLVPGPSLHDELAALVEAGLTPYQALRAATANAGAFLSDRFHAAPRGTVTPGARADLVLLSADPLVDIHNTTRIRGVLLRGRWLPAAAAGAPGADSVAGASRPGRGR
ncbi:MAG TPA: amidohydrolase family protein [Gemmatimonadaceae bacterium]